MIKPFHEFISLFEVLLTRSDSNSLHSLISPCTNVIDTLLTTPQADIVDDVRIFLGNVDLLCEKSSDKPELWCTIVSIITTSAFRYMTSEHIVKQEHTCLLDQFLFLFLKPPRLVSFFVGLIKGNVCRRIRQDTVKTFFALNRFFALPRNVSPAPPLSLQNATSDTTNSQANPGINTLEAYSRVYFGGNIFLSCALHALFDVLSVSYLLSIPWSEFTTSSGITENIRNASAEIRSKYFAGMLDTHMSVFSTSEIWRFFAAVFPYFTNELSTTQCLSFWARFACSALSPFLEYSVWTSSHAEVVFSPEIANWFCEPRMPPTSKLSQGTAQNDSVHLSNTVPRCLSFLLLPGIVVPAFSRLSGFLFRFSMNFHTSAESKKSRLSKTIPATCSQSRDVPHVHPSHSRAGLPDSIEISTTDPRISVDNKFFSAPYVYCSCIESTNNTDGCVRCCMPSEEQAVPCIHSTSPCAKSRVCCHCFYTIELETTSTENEDRGEVSILHDILQQCHALSWACLLVSNRTAGSSPLDPPDEGSNAPSWDRSIQISDSTSYPCPLFRTLLYYFTLEIDFSSSGAPNPSQDVLSSAFHHHNAIHPDSAFDSELVASIRYYGEDKDSLLSLVLTLDQYRSQHVVSSTEYDLSESNRITSTGASIPLDASHSGMGMNSSKDAQGIPLFPPTTASTPTESEFGSYCLSLLLLAIGPFSELSKCTQNALVTELPIHYPLPSFLSKVLLSYILFPLLTPVPRGSIGEVLAQRRWTFAVLSPLATKYSHATSEPLSTSDETDLFFFQLASQSLSPFIPLSYHQSTTPFGSTSPQDRGSNLFSKQWYSGPISSAESPNTDNAHARSTTPAAIETETTNDILMWSNGFLFVNHESSFAIESNPLFLATEFPSTNSLSHPESSDSTLRAELPPAFPNTLSAAVETVKLPQLMSLWAQESFVSNISAALQASLTRYLIHILDILPPRVWTNGAYSLPTTGATILSTMAYKYIDHFGATTMTYYRQVITDGRVYSAPGVLLLPPVSSSTGKPLDSGATDALSSLLLLSSPSAASMFHLITLFSTVLLPAVLQGVQIRMDGQSPGIWGTGLRMGRVLARITNMRIERTIWNPKNSGNIMQSKIDKNDESSRSKYPFIQEVESSPSIAKKKNVHRQSGHTREQGPLPICSYLSLILRASLKPLGSNSVLSYQYQLQTTSAHMVSVTHSPPKSASELSASNFSVSTFHTCDRFDQYSYALLWLFARSSLSSVLPMPHGNGLASSNSSQLPFPTVALANGAPLAHQLRKFEVAIPPFHISQRNPHFFPNILLLEATSGVYQSESIAISNDISRTLFAGQSLDINGDTEVQNLMKSLQDQLKQNENAKDNEKQALVFRELAEEEEMDRMHWVVEGETILQLQLTILCLSSLLFDTKTKSSISCSSSFVDTLLLIYDAYCSALINERSLFSHLSAYLLSYVSDNGFTVSPKLGDSLRLNTDGCTVASLLGAIEDEYPSYSGTIQSIQQHLLDLQQYVDWLPIQLFLVHLIRRRQVDPFSPVSENLVIQVPTLDTSLSSTLIYIHTSIQGGNPLLLTGEKAPIDTPKSSNLSALMRRESGSVQLYYDYSKTLQLIPSQTILLPRVTTLSTLASPSTQIIENRTDPVMIEERESELALWLPLQQTGIIATTPSDEYSSFQSQLSLPPLQGLPSLAVTSTPRIIHQLHVLSRLPLLQDLLNSDSKGSITLMLPLPTSQPDPVLRARYEYASLVPLTLHDYTRVLTEPPATGAPESSSLRSALPGLNPHDFKKYSKGDGGDVRKFIAAFMTLGHAVRVCGLNQSRRMELLSEVPELLAILLRLEDKYSTPYFHFHRKQAIISCIVTVFPLALHSLFQECANATAGDHLRLEILEFIVEACQELLGEREPSRVPPPPWMISTFTPDSSSELPLPGPAMRDFMESDIDYTYYNRVREINGNASGSSNDAPGSGPSSYDQFSRKPFVIYLRGSEKYWLPVPVIHPYTPYSSHQSIGQSLQTGDEPNLSISPLSANTLYNYAFLPLFGLFLKILPPVKDFAHYLLDVSKAASSLSQLHGVVDNQSKPSLASIMQPRETSTLANSPSSSHERQTFSLFNTESTADQVKSIMNSFTISSLPPAPRIGPSGQVAMIDQSSSHKSLFGRTLRDLFPDVHSTLSGTAGVLRPLAGATVIQKNPPQRQSTEGKTPHHNVSASVNSGTPKEASSSYQSELWGSLPVLESKSEDRELFFTQCLRVLLLLTLTFNKSLQKSKTEQLPAPFVTMIELLLALLWILRDYYHPIIRETVLHSYSALFPILAQNALSWRERTSILGYIGSLRVMGPLTGPTNSADTILPVIPGIATPVVSFDSIVHGNKNNSSGAGAQIPSRHLPPGYGPDTIRRNGLLNENVKEIINRDENDGIVQSPCPESLRKRRQLVLDSITEAASGITLLMLYQRLLESQEDDSIVAVSIASLLRKSDKSFETLDGYDDSINCVCGRVSTFVHESVLECFCSDTSFTANHVSYEGHCTLLRILCMYCHYPDQTEPAKSIMMAKTMRNADTRPYLRLFDDLFVISQWLKDVEILDANSECRKAATNIRKSGILNDILFSHDAESAALHTA